MRIAVKLVFAGAVAAGAVAAEPLQGLAADEPEKIITYRRNVMKAQGAHITNIAAVAKGEVTFVGMVPVHARALADLTKLIVELFPEGTGVGDTRALPAIWSERAKFDEAAKATGAAAAEMVAAAESGDAGAIAQAVGKLGKACGGCHDDFRKKEEQ